MSVSAGPYAAPPAAGPSTTEICGILPEAWVIAKKILPTACRRQHALGQPGAAGVPQPDDRQLFAPRHLVRLDDDLAALVAHRATHHGGVGAERDDRRAGDRAADGEHAGQVVGRDQLEGARVEQVRSAG